MVQRSQAAMSLSEKLDTGKNHHLLGESEKER